MEGVEKREGNSENRGEGDSERKKIERRWRERETVRVEER